MVSRRYRVVSVFLATLLVAVGLNAVAQPAMAADATCDCVESGAFVAPTAVEPYVPSGLDGLSAEEDGRYRLTVGADVSGTSLTIRRVSNNQVVLSLVTQLTQWGFSPDQDTFVLTGNANGLRDIRVYSLTSGTPSAPVFHRETVTASDTLMFSPHGEFFVYAWVQTGTSNMVNLDLRRSADGDQRNLATFSYSVTDAGGKQFGASGWGFSPDDDEFVYAWVTGGTTEEARVVNLEAEQNHNLGQLLGSAAVSFSSCGTVVATRSEAVGGNQKITLWNTATGSVAGTGTYPLGPTTLATTPAGHVATVNGTPHTLAPVTPSTPDRCAPAWPEGAELTAGEVTASSVALEWTEAVDATGVTEYRVFRGSTQVGTTAANVREFTVTGLSEDTQYTFRVQARDAAGNQSTSGPTVQARTAGSNPTWPSGSSMCATKATNTTVDLCWTEATDNQAVTGYRIFVDGQQRAEVPASPRRYTVTGLEPGTLYQFRVEARDAQGNVSTGGPTTAGPTTARGTGAAGTISGIVWSDLNANRYRDTGEYLNAVSSSMRVRAFRVGPSGLILESRAGSVSISGHYTITDVPDGTWTVVLSGHNSFKGWPQTEPSDQQPHVVSVAGAGVTGVDFGVGGDDYDIPANLPTVGSFSATAWDDTNLNGVRDAGEGPLVGVSASCYYINTLGGVSCPAVSGSDGVIENTGLPPGSYQVHGGMPQGGGWYRAAATTDTYLLTVGSGSVECDEEPSSSGAAPAFGWTRGQASVTGEFFVDHDADGVRDPGEDGLIKDPSVWLHVCLEGPVGPVCNFVDDMTGEFTVDDLVPGTYTVSVLIDTPGWQLSPPGTLGTVVISSNSAVVDLGEFGVEGSRRGTIIGHVFKDLNGDGIRQLGEPGIADFGMCATVSSDERVCVRTAADGSYVVKYAETGIPRPVYPNDPGNLVLTTYDDWYQYVELAEGETRTLDWGWADSPVPSEPRSLNVEAGQGSFTATWQPPEREGDHPVTGYVLSWIAQRENADWEYAQAGNVLTHTVTGLDPGVTYQVYVFAVSEAGGGEWSEGATVVPLDPPVDPPVTPPVVTPPVTPPVVTPPIVTPPAKAPAAPGKPKAKLASKSVTLSWAAPANTGGAPITGYRVQRATKEKGPWSTVAGPVGAARSVKVTGLKNGTKYYFRVAALNAAGAGEWSASVAATPRTTPGAPGKPKASAKVRSVKLTWAKPATGGAKITDYVIQRATKKGGPWTTVKDGTSVKRSHTVGKLKKGKTYYFRIAAKNAAGRGAWSKVVRAVPR